VRSHLIHLPHSHAAPAAWFNKAVEATPLRSCYIEFGAGRIGRVDIDFFSNPDGPTGTFCEPSIALRADKEHFGSSRRARWFGL